MLALAGLLLLTAAVYTPGLRGEFQFDDLRTVESNQSIRRLDNALWAPSLSDVVRGRRIVTDFTFALNYRLAGRATLAFHLTNLAIHLGATILAFLFARRMLELVGCHGPDRLALVIAALFALHPLQSQAVAYVSQRAESLASALYLGSLLLLLGAERRGRNAAGIALYLGSLAGFALGLGAKVIVVTFPLAYLLIGLLPGPQEREQLARPSRRLALIAPFFLLILIAVPTAAATGPGLLTGVDAGANVPSLPPWRYFLTQWHVIVTYLRLLFWPAGQNVDWDFPLARGLGDPVVLACGFFLSSLLVGAGILLLRARDRDGRAGVTSRASAFGTLWFFLLLAPTSSLVPLADVLMEHRLYLASWGAFFAVVVVADAVLARLTQPRRSRVAMAVVLAMCALFASATYLRVGLWSSKLLLWTDAATKSPYKARAHLGLGNAYRLSGQLQLSVAEYLTALGLTTNDPRWIRSEIRGKLAATLLLQARSGEAIAIIQAGLAEDPNDGVLLGVLALAHLQRHELPQAEAAAEQSVRNAREPVAALRTLGLVRLEMGNPGGAISRAGTHARGLRDSPLYS
jgi:hypothetical protein